MIHRASRFAFCPRDGTALVPTRIDGRDRPTCPVCGFADFMHVQIGANTIVLPRRIVISACHQFIPALINPDASIYVGMQCAMLIQSAA